MKTECYEDEHGANSFNPVVPPKKNHTIPWEYNDGYTKGW